MRVATVLALSAVFCAAQSSTLPNQETEVGRVGNLEQLRSRSQGVSARHEDDDDDEEHLMHSMSHLDSSSEANSSMPTTIPVAESSHQHGGHDHHHSHAKPLTEYNESDTIFWHGEDPLSYLDHDSTTDGHRGVLVVHVLFATLAFFALLPLALFLKAAKSPFAALPQVLFIACATISMLFGALYSSLSPNLYEGDSHSRLGWVLMIIVYALNALDLLQFFARAKQWYSGRNKSERKRVVEPHVDDEAQEALFVASPVEETIETDWTHSPAGEEADGRKTSLASSEGTAFEEEQFDHRLREHVKQDRRSSWRKAGRAALVIIEYSTVILGYVETLSGIAVYTGKCRSTYINGCMAHTIKGSIFLWYGLLTFARYVGAFSRLGWAWNRRPDGKQSVWTAEFVESTVIFVYGASNTWLERLGKGDSPYSIKDIQHISIAVMFWFCGLLGMLLESQSVRSWLSFSARSNARSTRVVEPASYKFSFNPFPALVIGVTGVAMSAHHQEYQFQVDIHALWGLLLGGFAALRFMTYFFLYLRPPASVLPSRPPTEALASFALTAGGVVFILSVEQVSFAAMKAGYDDMMAFLNFTVALVSIWFVWIVALFALKGWASKRVTRQVNGLVQSAKTLA